MTSLAILSGREIDTHGCIESLADLMLRIARSYPERGISYVNSSGAEEFVRYPELVRTARGRLTGLHRRGLRAGDKVVVEIDDAKEFFFVFWACVFGGIVPAPIAQPSSCNPDSSSLQKLRNVWLDLGRPAVLVDRRDQPRYEELARSPRFPGLVFHAAQDLACAEEAEIHPSQPDELVFLQYSSGSTGTPRGVMLTNRNLYVNNVAISAGSRLDASDKACTWLPHTHDMGLIGQHILAIFNGNGILKFSPASFVRAPLVFLKKFGEHRASWTCCPNFGFDWMNQKIKPEDVARLDLSSLRLIFNGAEPISVGVMRRFTEKFAPAGLPPTSMFPVYGMAEATLAVAFPEYGRLPTVARISRRALVDHGRAARVAAQDEDGIEIVSEGWPVAALHLRIAGEAGAVLEQGAVGEIQIRGAAVTSAYYEQPEANAASFVDGWFRTGDVGFLLDGMLYVNGRIKDVIFVNGQNFYAHDVEESVYALGKVARGGLAVVGSFNHVRQVEELLVFVKHKGPAVDILPLADEIRARVASAFRLQVTHVIPVSKVPKTSSGKSQRFQLKHHYESDAYADVLRELAEASARGAEALAS